MKQDIFEAGNYYHIYNRGNNKENIFIEEENYFYFLKLLVKYIVPIADVYSYCLLKNHFHILLKIKDHEELPEKYQTKIHLPFSNLFNTYAKSINKAYDRTGSLFQEHLKRNRVLDENYLKQLVVYIHLNPVKHRFSDQFETYFHSSYRAYLSNKETNVAKDYILELFGGLENFISYHNENKIKYEGVLIEINESDFD
jgi:REP element-mobilizing transposase RayT